MIDRIEIYVFGGNGGSGMMSLRREKFIPFGGPDGGDGGDGGNVVLVADRSRTTLSDLRRQKHYRATNGENGKSKDQHGRKGSSLYLKVPIGTIVRSLSDDEEEDQADLVFDGQEVVVAKGGCGGRGNKHFSSSIKQTPRFAQEGEKGEEKKLWLDLKLLADVGLIGRPNVGKSTLINAVSAAKSRVADYPFTTLEPKLGVVEMNYKSFVIADIPGLIEGAHTGHGLGHDFLRHIERTRMLVHIVDGTTQHPAQDLKEINEELFLFNDTLKEKSQIVVVNKIDIPEVSERLGQIRAELGSLQVPVCYISAASGEGVTELMSLVAKKLEESVPATLANVESEFKVFRPKPIN
ncbi:MAG: GTPase ObgE [Chloroflexota bacterium]|nr:GTPase ObgE [Chloroflexota bacterium]